MRHLFGPHCHPCYLFENKRFQRLPLFENKRFQRLPIRVMIKERQAKIRRKKPSARLARAD